MRLFLRVNTIMKHAKRQRIIWILWSLSIILPLILILFENSDAEGDRTVIAGNVVQSEHVPGKIEGEAGKSLALTEPGEAQETITGVPENSEQNQSDEGSEGVNGKGAISGVPEPEEEGKGNTSEMPEPGEEDEGIIGIEPETGDSDEEEENTEPEESGTEEITDVPNQDTKEERVIDPEKPMVALTFDDGPYRNNTKVIMDLFEQYGGRATFFVVGYHLDVYTEATLEAYRRGFQIGNHTLNHPALRQISDAEGMAEIEGLNRKLNELGIPGEVMLRPPYGEFTQYLQENLTVPMIGWNVDSADWLTKDAENIYERVVGKVKDGDIVLLHDLHDATAEAMQRVVPALVEQGFQLVTVEELFRVKGIVPQAGEYYCYVR